MGYVPGNFGLDGYRRRIEARGAKLRHRDVPHDVAELLELSRDIELIDRIIVDSSDRDE